MGKKLIIGTIAAAGVLMSAGSCCEKDNHGMGTFGYDADYFKQKGIETIILTDKEKEAQVMVIPAYQGRVMTSSASGAEGNSYGWINYKLIDSGEVNPQFNPIGGEERFWLGPEGGPFSLYFAKDIEQVYANWKVPAILDTEPFEVTERSESKVGFKASADLTNASGHKLEVGIERSVELLGKAGAEELLGVGIPQTAKLVAYKSVNTITNTGSGQWDEEMGMPSVWMLCTFNPTATTTVFIPYRKEAEKIVNDEYFGKVPSDRLIVDEDAIFFKIDGLHRTKIGLPAGSAKDICGSYDSEKKVLTILKYTVPQGEATYVNSQWGPQDDPFCGDVINSYNDGPTETGTVMGPFYEIETSSPAAKLAPGECLTHEEWVVHIEGEDSIIDAIVKKVFGIGLEKIVSVF